MFVNIVKKLIRPFIIFLHRDNNIRKILTSNFSSEKIALGEKRIYAVLPHNWLMLDIIDADINLNLSKEALPFKNNSKKIIYSSHFFEHINHNDTINLLNECLRVLKPKGILRIEVPNFERVLNFYKENDIASLDRLQFENKTGSYHNIVAGMAACYVENGKHRIDSFDKERFDELVANSDIDTIGNWCISNLTEEQKNTYGHQNFFYFKKWYNLLNEIGFKNIKECKIKETSFRGRIPFERDWRSFYSITVECSK